MKVLITPLNWGLGHATRCIPIIRYLLEKRVDIFLASDGRAAHLLKSEFPNLPFFELPSYGIRYPYRSMVLNLAIQSRRFFAAKQREHQAVKKIVVENQIDVIISDNRFGCFHTDTKNIFITHQVQLPLKNKLLQSIASKINWQMIKVFDELWIPDYASENNLAGTMTQINDADFTTRYLGALTRMQKLSREQRYDFIAVLSGPEPQRTKLEKIIIEQTIKTEKTALIVQGISENGMIEKSINQNIQFVSFLPSELLNEAIAKSRVLIARSGYSTIMDLIGLQTPALFIPTPGQYEQEVLAQHLMQRKICYSVNQDDFNLERDLNLMSAYQGFPKNEFDLEQYKGVIDQLIRDLQAGSRGMSV